MEREKKKYLKQWINQETTYLSHVIKININSDKSCQ